MVRWIAAKFLERAIMMVCCAAEEMNHLEDNRSWNHNSVTETTGVRTPRENKKQIEPRGTRGTDKKRKVVLMGSAIASALQVSNALLFEWRMRN